jgi:hypothetical protein
LEQTLQRFYMVELKSTAYQRMMTAPAIIRLKEIDTNIGPMSHSRRSNFWMPAMRTAFLWRECKLSVTGSCQALDGDERSRLSFDPGVEGNRKEAPAVQGLHRYQKQVCQCS